MIHTVPVKTPRRLAWAVNEAASNRGLQLHDSGVVGDLHANSVRSRSLSWQWRGVCAGGTSEITEPS